MKNANLLLSIGESMYRKAKKLIFCGPVGLVCLLITMAFCKEYAPLYLVFCGDYDIVNIMVGLWYLMIIIGICLTFPYFLGLILIGLGQIAKNTDPSNNGSGIVTDELPDL